MGPTAAPSRRAGSFAPSLRRALGQALWCWLAVALAFGLSRAAIALGSGLAPVPFAAYSVALFVLIPALPALVVIAVVAGAEGNAPPAWVHAAVVGLVVGGWAFFATQSFGWGLSYAAAGGLAAAVGVLARILRGRWSRVGATVLGTALIGAGWYWLETLG